MNRNRELDSFEHDDWLQKERARENRISAWDFDDARKLRQDHEDDCHAEEAAQFHRVRHQQRSSVMNDRSLSQMNGSTMSKDIAWFIIDIVAIFLMISLNTVTMRFWSFYWPVVILFLGVNPGVFIWLGIRKRFPPARYSKSLLLFAILIEIAGLAYYYTYYYYHLFRR